MLYIIYCIYIFILFIYICYFHIFYNYHIFSSSQVLLPLPNIPSILYLHNIPQYPPIISPTLVPTMKSILALLLPIIYPKQFPAHLTYDQYSILVTPLVIFFPTLQYSTYSYQHPSSATPAIFNKIPQFWLIICPILVTAPVPSTKHVL